MSNTDKLTRLGWLTQLVCDAVESKHGQELMQQSSCPVYIHVSARMWSALLTEAVHRFGAIHVLLSVQDGNGAHQPGGMQGGIDHRLPPAYALMRLPIGGHVVGVVQLAGLGDSCKVLVGGEHISRRGGEWCKIGSDADELLEYARKQPN